MRNSELQVKSLIALEPDRPRPWNLGCKLFWVC
jgi:hypothetical protein